MGRRLCITAGIHGDEINGTEIARRAFSWIDPKELSGTVIVFPMVNAAGVRSGNRYMQDRRDLNREFPGRSNGSVTSIVAHTLFTEIRRNCQYLIDLHTGSFSRSNHPQIRVTAKDETALELARHFGLGIVVLSEGPNGSIRREAGDIGIPAIIYEAGEPSRFDLDQIAAGVQGIESVMAYLRMIEGGKQIEVPESRIYTQDDLGARTGGRGWLLLPDGELGQAVSQRRPPGHHHRPADRSLHGGYGQPFGRSHRAGRRPDRAVGLRAGAFGRAAPVGPNGVGRHCGGGGPESSAQSRDSGTYDSDRHTLGDSPTHELIPESIRSYRRWMFRSVQIFFSSRGHTVTPTSPRCAFFSSNM